MRSKKSKRQIALAMLSSGAPEKVEESAGVHIVTRVPPGLICSTAEWRRGRSTRTPHEDHEGAARAAAGDAHLACGASESGRLRNWVHGNGPTSPGRPRRPGARGGGGEG